MIGSDMGKQKALKELLEVLSRGVDLLANDNLDKDLYDAFEKYADSTMKMFGEAYNRQSIWNFPNNYMPYNYFKSFDNIYDRHMVPCNTAMTAKDYCLVHKQSAEYKEKLKILLQKLIAIAKTVVYE